VGEAPTTPQPPADRPGVTPAAFRFADLMVFMFHPGNGEVHELCGEEKVIG
jgi:hypothetical protein